MNRTLNAVSVGLLLFSVLSQAITYWAESTVEAHSKMLSNDTVVQDVNIYSTPDILRPGDEIEATLKNLASQSDSAEAKGICSDRSLNPLTILERLPPRRFCMNGRNAFLKQAWRQPSYIFELRRDKKKVVIETVQDMSGNMADRAEIYSSPRATFRINREGRTDEQVRQVLIVNPDELRSDAVRIGIIEENARIYDPWFQGTDWVGLVRAVKMNFLKVIGINKGHYQGATSLFEQLSKTAFLDPNDPPPPKYTLSGGTTDKDSGATSRLEKWSGRVVGLYRFTKRRILSAYLAESLCQRFPRDELIMKSLNSTSYGIEMTRLDNSKLNHAEQIKESIWGPKTAARAFFDKGLDKLTPMEQASLAVAPRDPAILRILQKRNRSAREREMLSASSGVFLIRVKTALDRYAHVLESEGDHEKAKGYRSESSKIPDGAEAQKQFSAEGLERLLPALRIHEDDRIASENPQLLERESVRREVSDYLATNRIEYSDLKNMKVAVVSTGKRGLERELAAIIEKSSGEITRNLSRSLLPGRSKLDFDVMVETVIADEDGRIAAAASVRVVNGRVIPNRKHLNYPTFVGSIAKVVGTTAAIGLGRLGPETVVCSTDAVSPNGYAFEGTPANECVTVAEGLQRSLNWVQIAIRNIVGPAEALKMWELATNTPIAVPPGFNGWRKFDQDQWIYEQARGVNADTVSKSVIDVVAMLTPMANEGKRSEPTYLRKIWIGDRSFEPQISSTQVFPAEAVAAVSEILQKNGRAAFGLGDESPAVKTGSTHSSYWNAVWSRNLVLVSRVVVMKPRDETVEKRLEEIDRLIAKLKEEGLEKEIPSVEAEKRSILYEKEQARNEFEKELSVRSKRIYARDVVQPLNVKVVQMLYNRARYFFHEPSEK